MTGAVIDVAAQALIQRELQDPAQLPDTGRRARTAAVAAVAQLDTAAAASVLGAWLLP